MNENKNHFEFTHPTKIYEKLKVNQIIIRNSYSFLFLFSKFLSYEKVLFWYSYQLFFVQIFSEFQTIYYKGFHPVAFFFIFNHLQGFVQ